VRPGGMSETIVLVRHGRSGHVHSGWIDAVAFRRWREAYEAAGIDPDDVPPPDLQALAASSGILVASTARRAVESAKALAPGREVFPSPLLEELELSAPGLGPIRLPLLGWALMVGARWLARVALARGRLASGEVQRVRAAAEWLSRLAGQRGSVVVVTHASFRSALARELVRSGWQSNVASRRPRHWSAWSFTRRASSRVAER
jgi:broad specificity phosphatase PhoE